MKPTSEEQAFAALLEGMRADAPREAAPVRASTSAALRWSLMPRSAISPMTMAAEAMAKRMETTWTRPNQVVTAGTSPVGYWPPMAATRKELPKSSAKRPIAAAPTATIAMPIVVARRRDLNFRISVTVRAAGGVLVAAPAWFVSYADYLAPAAALCVATGATAIGRARHASAGWLPRGAAVAGAVVDEAGHGGHGALERLDDLIHADLLGGLREAVAAVRAASGLHQLRGDEDLHRIP